MVHQKGRCLGKAQHTSQPNQEPKAHSLTSHWFLPYLKRLGSKEMTLTLFMSQILYLGQTQAREKRYRGASINQMKLQLMTMAPLAGCHLKPLLTTCNSPALEISIRFLWYTESYSGGWKTLEHGSRRAIKEERPQSAIRIVWVWKITGKDKFW